jgi:AcrR family transcriptional regulator
MYRRARSAEDKQRRAEDLLDAARALATELGGVRHITLTAVTERAGLHSSGVRRYFASKEELLLELAERGWNDWRNILTARLTGQHDLSPAETARILSVSISSLPLFCDLLTHITLSLEGDVDLNRARRYKADSFAAYDVIVGALSTASALSAAQVEDLIAVTLGLTASLWQLSHPTDTLKRLYEEVPRWGHAALDFETRLARLLEATATGLVATGQLSNYNAS